jgi:uncharacterized protein YyaL (SSP411 family)
MQRYQKAIPMPNRLASSSSPYLQQHKDNPVDWYQWGTDALQRARDEDKPILVSIGYSACHWCHVMAHESFENQAIADRMNAWFINIKVDREERPDIDAIYMSALQAMSGQGGWPLNVFLTPDGEPFFGGTYWPPQAMRGMPGFADVLEALHRAWETRRDDLTASAARLTEYLKASSNALKGGDEAGERTTEQAADALWEQFDHEHGGFGSAPKFPQASVLEFLLRHTARTGSERARTMLTTTLDRMAAGGIHDHLGGGFARYSVDRVWMVPHFEKMLYDNAQLLKNYLDAWRLTGADRYREVVTSTADWLLREMRAPEGGFYAALDADSEGVEGKYYVWTEEEIDGVLAPDAADLVRHRYGVTPEGHLEGASILHEARSLDDLAGALGRPRNELATELDAAWHALFTAREQRVRPGTDTKVIVSWNGLAIGALAEAGSALGERAWIDAARDAATVIWERARTADGRLARLVEQRSSSVPGMLEDHAFLADGFLALYRATADLAWLERANELEQAIVNDFRHESGAGYYDVGSSHESLVVRPRDLQDGAIPCGTSVTCDLHLTLAHLSLDESNVATVDALLSSLSGASASHPTAFGRWLAVLERRLAPARQIVLVGETIEPLRQVVGARYAPFVGLAYGVEGEAESRWPTLADRPLPAGSSGAAFVCQGRSCLPPVTETTALRELLDRPPD